MSASMLDLDGLWEFFYSPQALSPDPESLPAEAAFTGHMVTPGYWDDHYNLFDEEDFFGLTARFNPDYRPPHFPCGRTLTPHASSSFLIGTGYYRRMLPPLESGMLATLRIGPAMWGGTVFCNRQCAGQIVGYSTATEFPMEELMYSDRPNELIIAVCNRHDDGGAYCRLDGSHDGIARGARPGQHRGLAVQGYQSERGGIAEGVSLKLSRQATITDWFPSFDGQRIHCVFSVRGQSGWTLKWALCDGETVLFSGGTSGTNWECDASALAHWNDRNPKLYQLTLDLILDGETVDSVSCLWAPRTFKSVGKDLHLNGHPVYLRGVTEHCYFPETCNPHWDEAKYLHDLGVLKQAGFNFIRCHTWCPPETFYTACDKLGILVQTELPVVWSWTEAEAIIRMIRRHPCAVLFCEGNEKIIDEAAIIRLRQLADKLHQLAPGMLFNPQEAMRGIEYEFKPEQKICVDPFEYDPARLEAVNEIADVYGALFGGFFSYGHDGFPGAEVLAAQQKVYGRPCLSHEIGILGGYLDFLQEKRYEGTFIGTDLFRAARENMIRHGVYQYARLYYERNCRFISSIRKQLVENIRSCDCIAGYDYLGGIDTHWHLTGYPCGIFNEFYEEKFGETSADVLCYNNETVLLCGAGKWRNRQAGKHFREKILISHYGANDLLNGELDWHYETGDGTVIASGVIAVQEVKQGTLSELGTLEFELPDWAEAHCCTLCVQFSAGKNTWKNHWKFWVFPVPHAVKWNRVRLAESFSEETIRFMADGGAVLLSGGFPGVSLPENFRPHTSGRSLGHSGAIPHEHPIWKRFPHDGFADWQFYPMMTGSHSLVTNPEMPEYQPVLELIPSFKLIKRKSLLSEFKVGSGRLMVCGFRLTDEDPAAVWMKQILLEYLEQQDYAPAPEWSVEQLKQRLDAESLSPVMLGKKIDAGGRPVD